MTALKLVLHMLKDFEILFTANKMDNNMKVTGAVKFDRRKNMHDYAISLVQKNQRKKKKFVDIVKLLQDLR